MKSRYHSTVHQADFEAAPDAARREINQTVADQTAGKITDLFPPESFDEYTRLVLTNALYLKADWAQAFPTDKTANEPFTRADGSTVTVPMMHNDPDLEPLGYAEGPGYQVVTLPYKGGGLAFTVIMPAFMEALHGKGIAVTPTLRASMPTAFTPAADFSAITDDVQLEIDSVRHKTFVQVDEKGTEAAAATGAEVKATAAVRPRTVTVDRPFLFVITDTATGAPLFLGRIGDPTA